MMITLSRSVGSKAAQLARHRATAIDEVGAITDRVRRLFITSIAGQEMIYLAKEREAQEYLSASPAPGDLSGFPFLAAEVLASGLPVFQVAEIILFKADQWRAVGAQIEALRSGVGIAIGGASSAGEITVVLDDFRQAMDDF
jgi:hypothetical protein